VDAKGNENWKVNVKYFYEKSKRETKNNETNKI